ncbi:uncharacterized protein [Nicotiana tomentosiformis]|uniref:uncharacterized protein n=1 Tax=Nicotiana tomentosiformis TaxID=4098 RepID=UPI00388C969B
MRILKNKIRAKLFKVQLKGNSRKMQWLIEMVYLLGVSKNLKKALKYLLPPLVLEEPFLEKHKLHHYRRRIGFPNAIANSSGKFWLFWDNDYSCNVISDKSQQITLEVKHITKHEPLWITVVYAKTKARRKKNLWRQLTRISNQIDIPWSIGGDFNIIMDASEKKGGNLHRLSKSIDFIKCMDECGMSDVGYSRSDYTWTNGRKKWKRILQRLDRVFYNDAWSSSFPIAIVRHLPKTGSDHNVLLYNCAEATTPPIKYFRCLDFWVDQPDSLRVVEEFWEEKPYRNAMYILHQKLKNLSHCLIRWSRENIRNIFYKVEEHEQQIENMVIIYDHDDSEINISRLYSLYAKGLKQGNPLSPGLFVIAAETLSKALNYLHTKEKYNGFSMNNRGPRINHLAYADDIVIFTSSDKCSIKKVMKTLHQYEEAPGQKISKEKSFILTSNYVSDQRKNMIKRVTNYNYQSFPFKYLGCSIFPGRKKICYYVDIAKKVMFKINGWQKNIFSLGGRAILIKHVLQSQAFHTFDAASPPKAILRKLEKYFSNFFWRKAENKNKYHWSSWNNICYPFEEGGAGFKKLDDLCKTFTAKRWWRLRIDDNLWAQFMKAKYFSRSHPVARALDFGTSTWKEFMHLKRRLNLTSCGKLTREVSPSGGTTGHVLGHWVFMKKNGVEVDMTWSWSQLCQKIERYRPNICSRAVTWDKPPDG